MKEKINFTKINSTANEMNFQKINENIATVQRTGESLTTLISPTHKQTIKGFIGHPINAETLLHYNSKSIVYSFKGWNNLQPLLTKTEYILKSFFLSMYSLISRPVYLIKHDKVIIRLFVYLSPKADSILDTSMCAPHASPLEVKEGKFVGIDPSILIKNKGKNNVVKLIKNFLLFKKIRPNKIEILNSQIQIYTLTDLYATGLSYNKFVQKLKKPYYDYILKKRGIELLVKTNPHLLRSTPIKIIDTTDLLTKSNKTSPYLYEEFPYISFASSFKSKLEILSVILKKIFKKEVEFEIIKAQLPFQDSNILAQVLGYNANNYKFRRMLKILMPRAVIKNSSKEFSYLPSNRPHKQGASTVSQTIDPLFAKKIATSLNLKLKDLNSLFSQPSSYLPPFFFSKYKGIDHSLTLEQINDPFHSCSTISPNISHNGQTKEKQKISYLSGMNIKLAGRLMTQSIRPRFTVQSKQEGSLARVKVHFTEKSRFTGKNKRGAFSFTVSLGHVFNIR